MEFNEVMKALEEMGNPGTKKTLEKHGAKEPFFGVKVGDLKKLVKKIKKNHKLSKELYATGNSDAMYLAGLIADETLITKQDLERWVKGAYWYYISEFTVPWIAADSPHGYELGLKWIESKKENIAAAGWATLANIAIVHPDDQIDLKVFKQLMQRVKKEIDTAPNRVRYTMNGFVIAIGTFIASLSDDAKKVAKAIGKVEVEMGGTSCKVPLATDYIDKVLGKAGIRKKKKMARC